MTSLPPIPNNVFPRTPMGLMRRPGLWPALIRATVELAVARRRLGRRELRDLMGVDRSDLLPSFKIAPEERTDATVARVAWAIPRVAARVPWRADCLVQATAAQRWLNQKGVQTHLHIGVRKDRPVGFAAHAWLCHGTHIVTGGDVSGFVPLVPSSAAERASSPLEDLDEPPEQQP